MTEANATVVAAVVGVLGLIIGALVSFWASLYSERNKESIATTREQLKYVFAPLEILLRMNKREFDRYFQKDTTQEDRIFIEKNVWYANNVQIKLILMEKSHLLTVVPDVLLDLLTHINVWLSEYQQIYVEGTKKPPVFGGPKGYGYPSQVDDYVYSECKKLRSRVNMK